MTKILWNHDHTAKPIGKYDFSDGRINFVFEEDVEISHEMMFEIFGNAGISVDRMERRDDGKGLIKAGHILEFSFSPASSEPAAPSCTCPSGAGSLRWPCPQHPPAESLGRDALSGRDDKIRDLILQYGNARAADNGRGSWQEQKGARDASVSAYSKILDHLELRATPPAIAEPATYVMTSVHDGLPPEGELVTVYQPDRGDGDRYDFDYIEDGGWAIHNERHEFFLSVGGAGAAGPDVTCAGPSEIAPYTHWSSLPKPEAASPPASCNPTTQPASVPDRRARAIQSIISEVESHGLKLGVDDNPEPRT